MTNFQMNSDGVNAHHDERQRNQTNSKTSRDNGEGEKKVMSWIKTMEKHWNKDG